MFRNPKRMGRWIVIALAIGLLCFSAALAKKPPKPPGGGGGDQGPAYTIVQLDDAGGAITGGVARDINDQRRIVGQVDDPLGGYLAACWTTSETNGVVQSGLHLLAGGEVANGINQWGEIVGAGEDGGQVVGLYWADHEADPLVLPPLAGDEESISVGINKDSVICGVSGHSVPRLDENGDPVFDNQGNPIFDRVSQAVVWRINGTDVAGPIELPSPDFASTAAINDNNADGQAEIVGGLQEIFPNTGPSWTAAVVWQVRSEADGTLTVGPSEILAIDARVEGVNNQGAICGYTPTPPYEAVVWDGDSLLVLDRSNFVYWAHAYDINDSGVIVGRGYYSKKRSEGSRAVVWPSASGSMILLKEFLDRDSPFTTLSFAEAVNESGEIVGAGWDGNNYGAFLAIPK